MQASNLPLRKWIFGMYLLTSSFKGVSSLKLHRDLGITQKSAWFMSQRIREGWNQEHTGLSGIAEVDEIYIGGKEGNKHKSKKLKKGRGTVGKAAVVGTRERFTGKIQAKPIESTGQKNCMDLLKTILR